jgi:hypothetical protein
MGAAPAQGRYGWQWSNSDLVIGGLVLAISTRWPASIPQSQRSRSPPIAEPSSPRSRHECTQQLGVIEARWNTNGADATATSYSGHVRLLNSGGFDE